MPPAQVKVHAKTFIKLVSNSKVIRRHQEKKVSISVNDENRNNHCVSGIIYYRSSFFC